MMFHYAFTMFYHVSWIIFSHIILFIILFRYLYVIANCQRDQKTVINQVTPASTIYSYDMMISSSPGCYPIVGSVDLSIYLYNDPLTCANVDAR